jgi:hypothetical protein
MKALKLTLPAAAGALAAAALATAALAHHAITLNYDPNVSGEVEGVVQEVFWANPHVHYYIEVADEGGATKLWDMETGNLNVMRSRGLTRTSIKIGDRVRAYGILGRDGSPAVLASSLTMVDSGDVLWGDPQNQSGGAGGSNY